MTHQEFPKKHISDGQVPGDGSLNPIWYSEMFAVLNELNEHLPRSYQGVFHPGISDAPFKAIRSFVNRLCDESPYGNQPHVSTSSELQSGVAEIRFGLLITKFRALVESVRESPCRFHAEKAQMLNRLMHAIHAPDDEENWHGILKLASALEDSGIPYQHNIIADMTELVVTLSDHVINHQKFEPPSDL
jgi:hypothetical protein